MSVTVTLNEPEVEFPAASVAMQLTVVVPSGKASPEAWSQPTATDPSTTSLAEVAKPTVVPPALVASAVRLPGKTRAGDVVSAIEIVKVPLADRPPPSVTEQETVVVPRAKVEPDAGEQTGVGSGLSSASTALAA